MLVSCRRGIHYNDGLATRLMSEEMNNNRLIWACRRGMLELDLVLQRFLDEAYPALAETDKVLFQQLLECEDQDLFGWLLRREVPNSDSVVRIVALIRDNCERSH